MVRSIKKDTRTLKTDLERIVTSGEKLYHSPKTFWSRVANGLKVIASTYLLCNDYVTVKKEVYKDSSVTNKEQYCTHMFFEGFDHLRNFILDNYVFA